MKSSSSRFKAGIVNRSFVFMMIALASTVAKATPFDFSANSTPSLQKSLTVDGITLNVSGQFRNLNNGGWEDGLVTQRLAGLGLRRPGGPADNSNELDSLSTNEFLLFEIDGLSAGQSLIIDSIAFGNFESGSDFSFYVDTTPAQVGGQTLGPGFDPGANPWILANDLTDAQRTASTSFAIKVNLGGNNEGEAFRIREINASVVSVPEPTIVTLLALGLLALGFARTEKHNTVA